MGRKVSGMRYVAAVSTEFSWSRLTASVGSTPRRSGDDRTEVAARRPLPATARSPPPDAQGSKARHAPGSGPQPALVVHTAAVALDTGVASAVTVDASA
jgi:hypothetical protein